MTRAARTAVLLAAGLALAGCSHAVVGTASPAAGGPAPSSSGSSGQAAGATTTCTWLPAGGGSVVDADLPPETVDAVGTTTLVLSLGQGDLTLTLDHASAPCAAASFVSLAEQGFFDGSPCHREVNQPGFGVLQCGDPTGTGSGGPPYEYAQETGPDTTYPRGAVAMANTGQPNSTGSQFFLCFVDTQLPPDYTVVGMVDDAGLQVLDRIAAAGNDGSLEPSPGGGAPNEPVTIESATVR